MNDVPKRYRDIAMRAICEFHKSKKPNTYMSFQCFYYKGLPKKVDAEHVANVLEAMGYIKLVKFPSGTEKYIEITEKGRCYFEVQKDRASDIKKRILWDLIKIIFGFLLGVLASNFTAILSWLDSLI